MNPPPTIRTDLTLQVTLDLTAGIPISEFPLRFRLCSDLRQKGNARTECKHFTRLRTKYSFRQAACKREENASGTQSESSTVKSSKQSPAKTPLPPQSEDWKLWKQRGQPRNFSLLHRKTASTSCPRAPVHCGPDLQCLRHLLMSFHPLVVSLSHNKLPRALLSWPPPIRTFPETHLSLARPLELASEKGCPQLRVTWSARAHRPQASSATPTGDFREMRSYQ